MDALEAIARFSAGIRFECGCEERGLHPAIQRALLDGRLKPDHLLTCPVHREPAFASRAPQPQWSPLREVALVGPEVISA